MDEYILKQQHLQDLKCEVQNGQYEHDSRDSGLEFSSLMSSFWDEKKYFSEETQKSFGWYF